MLEVGAGCGAVSRYLGETATEVVALEPSARRARVAAARCEGLPTVKVVVDDLESFARIGQRFNAVTLVGVLEYAHRFSDRSDAAVHWLRVARDLLRPGGVLLLAIENKLGLKYFAGAPEDHLGRPMLGIGDLYEDRGPRTWGRAELEAMLREAGYAATGFALPLPDKLPTSVLLSSDGDAMPGFDGGVALAEAAVGRDADLGGVPLFPMDRTWAVLAGNGLLVELANSFLVVAHADATELVYGAANASCSGYHYSVDRRPRFNKEATFLRGAGAGRGRAQAARWRSGGCDRSGNTHAGRSARTTCVAIVGAACCTATCAGRDGRRRTSPAGCATGSQRFATRPACHGPSWRGPGIRRTFCCRETASTCCRRT